MNIGDTLDGILEAQQFEEYSTAISGLILSEKYFSVERALEVMTRGVKHFPSELLEAMDSSQGRGRRVCEILIRIAKNENMPEEIRLQAVNVIFLYKPLKLVCFCLAEMREKREAKFAIDTLVRLAEVSPTTIQRPLGEEFCKQIFKMSELRNESNNVGSDRLFATNLGILCSELYRN